MQRSKVAYTYTLPFLYPLYHSQGLDPEAARPPRRGREAHREPRKEVIGDTPPNPMIFFPICQSYGKSTKYIAQISVVPHFFASV